MIAQLSPSAPLGSPSSSSIGVSCAGYFPRYSGFLPHTSCSSKSRPAARTKMRTVRLFTLGLRMFSVFVAMCSSLLVRILRRSILRKRRPRSPYEHLDCVREVFLIDVVVAPLDPQLVRLEQDIGVRIAERRLEPVRGELDEKPERILEVDRVHEAAVLDAAVPDVALVESLHRLPEGRLRDGERDVVDRADIGRGTSRVRGALLVRKDRDQPPVAGVEVEVAFRLVVEVRLVEDERHAEHALPEVDRRLPVGAHEGDVVDALALELSHRSTSFDLYSLRAKLPHGTRSTRVWMTNTLRSLSRIASASAVSGVASGASSTLTGSGGSCFTPADCGLTSTCPLTSGANPLTTSRTADGKTLTPRTISMSSVLPRQRIRGPVRPQRHGLVRTSTWSRVRKRSKGAARCCRWVRTSSPSAPSSSSRAAPDSGSISSAWTRPRAPRCMPSCSSHSPQSETPMSPMPIASVTLAPHPSSSCARKAGSPPPGSPATRTRSTLEPLRSKLSARCAA